MLALFLLIFHSDEPLCIEVVEKDSECGLGKGTKEICGVQESPGIFVPRKIQHHEAMVSHQAHRQMPSAQKGLMQEEQPEETEPGSPGTEGTAWTYDHPNSHMW